MFTPLSRVLRVQQLCPRHVCRFVIARSTRPTPTLFSIMSIASVVVSSAAAVILDVVVGAVAVDAVINRMNVVIAAATVVDSPVAIANSLLARSCTRSVSCPLSLPEWSILRVGGRGGGGRSTRGCGRG